MNRAERRIARVLLDKAVRLLGRAIQHRDRARDALAADEIWLRGERLAGRATSAMELRFSAIRSALDAAEHELDVARADVAAREDALDAARLDIIIDHHLTDIGLDALGY